MKVSDLLEHRFVNLTERQRVVGTFDNYQEWIRACRQLAPNSTVSGPEDYKQMIDWMSPNNKLIGEWKRGSGVVYESVESASPEEANRAKIAQLEDELSHMPSNPQSQKEYDMIEDLKDQIARLKAGAAA